MATVPGGAGPEKITFPANYKDHVLYATSKATLPGSR